MVLGKVDSGQEDMFFLGFLPRLTSAIIEILNRHLIGGQNHGISDELFPG